MSFFLDTSCIVPAVCVWHQHHEPAALEVGRRLAAGERMITAAHALAESFSVLTRLPAPYRISPADALALLEGNFMARASIVALPATGYRQMLRRAAAAGVGGGRVYDGVIAACARKAKVDTFLTFNAGHFADLPAAGVKVIVPSISG